MRQPRDEFRTKPHESIGTAALGTPKWSAEQLGDHRAWSVNQLATQAHHYCVKNAGYNLSSASLSKEEEVAFGNCLKLYAQSFQLFNKEKSVFNRGLEEIAA
jgi:hypothetical protein